MTTAHCIALLYPSAIHGSSSQLVDDVARLRAALPESEVIEMFDRPPTSWTVDDEHWMDRVDVAVMLDDAAEALGRMRRLTWVQSVMTGVDHVDTDAVAGAGVRLTTAAGTSSTEIAEFVVARVLEHWKRLPEIGDAQRDRHWHPMYGRPMTGSEVLLVGFGAIHRRVATLLAPFGVRLTAVRRERNDATPGVDAVITFDELDGALARADAALVALPSTPETDGMFDAARFEQMRPGAFFCNVGRGSAVVESALIASLSSGRLAGAALDVVATEPLPENDQMWESGARISPHSSSVPNMAITRVLDLVVENLGLLDAGRPLRNEVSGG